MKVFGFVPFSMPWGADRTVELMFPAPLIPHRLSVHPDVAPYYWFTSVQFDDEEQIISPPRLGETEVQIPAEVFCMTGYLGFSSAVVWDAEPRRLVRLRVRAVRPKPPGVNRNPVTWFRRLFWWFSRERRAARRPEAPQFRGAFLAREP